MKQLIPMDDYGVFVDTKDTARANSLLVAAPDFQERKRMLVDYAERRAAA